MRVLVAPDKFKGTLSAAEAASIIGSVLEAHGHVVDLAPMADGGDGTLEVFLRQGFASLPVAVVDAAGRPRASAIGRRGQEAVVELAATCGLATVLDRPLDPWGATSRGLGQAAAAAVANGATEIRLCLGGSASIDGGIGLLRGLGWEVVDAAGRPVAPGLAGLARAQAVTGSGPAGPMRWTVLADVISPLTGPRGAVVFAPQKGLDAAGCATAEEALSSWAGVLREAFGRDVADLPGAGAAGGVGAAAAAALGARIVSGAAQVADILGLAERVAACDAVVTGEGRFDEQSQQGKAAGVVIALARAAGRPVHVVAGSVAPGLGEAGCTSIHACTEPASGLPDDPAAALAAAAHRLAELLG